MALYKLSISCSYAVKTIFIAIYLQWMPIAIIVWLTISRAEMVRELGRYKHLIPSASSLFPVAGGTPLPLTKMDSCMPGAGTRQAFWTKFKSIHYKGILSRLFVGFASRAYTFITLSVLLIWSFLSKVCIVCAPVGWILADISCSILRNEQQHFRLYGKEFLTKFPSPWCSLGN